MIFDDDEPNKKTATFKVGQNLADYSVTELNELLLVLDSEIDRVKADMVNKNQSKSDAQSVFKK